MNPALVTAMLVAGPAPADGPRAAAVVYEIAPGWHIYWENPGDSGIPTEATLRAPAGIDVGPARYPGPEIFAVPGGLVNYGYERQTALLFELHPTGDAPLTRGILSADTSWLVCRDDQCIPGKASLEVDLSAPGTDLAPFLADLPRPVAGERHGDTLVVHIAGATDVAVVPDRTLEPDLRGVTTRPDGDGVRCAIGLAPAATGRAVLSVTGPTVAGGASHRYYEVRIPERSP